MPSLTILAGPNGAGKSRNTNFLLSENLLTALPVDLDFLVVQAYNDLSHSYYGAEERLVKSVDRLFYNYCKDAIGSNHDFCYECNFRKDQLKYVGYSKRLDIALTFLISAALKKINKGWHYAQTLITWLKNFNIFMLF